MVSLGVFIYIKPSFHGRQDELGPGAIAARPTGRDRLQSRVETDAVRTVDVQVPEKRISPAAKTVECHRYRYRHVDPNHPPLDLTGECAGAPAVSSEYGRAVGKLVPIDEVGR